MQGFFGGKLLPNWTHACRCWSWWPRPTTFQDEKRGLLRFPNWTPSTSKSTRWHQPATLYAQDKKKGSNISSGELSLCRPGQGQGWSCHEEGLWAQFHNSQPSSGFSTLSPVQVSFSKSPSQKAPLQVEACFKKFDKDKDGMLNFVEFKNFMGKRKSLPDKVIFFSNWQNG